MAEELTRLLEEAQYDILGIGNYAIILRSKKNPDKVYKIALGGSNPLQEFEVAPYQPPNYKLNIAADDIDFIRYSVEGDMNSGPFLDKWNYWFKTTEGKRIYLNRNAKDIDVNNIYDYKLSYDEKIGMVFEPKPKSELKIYVISGYSSTVTSYAFTKDGLIFSYENNY